MTQLVYSITLFASMLFFCLSAMLGSGGLDSENRSYPIYCIVVFALFFLTYFKDRKGNSIYMSTVLSIFIVLLYLFMAIWAGYMQDTAFLTLGAFCLPVVCLACRFANRNSLSGIVKWLDVLLLIFTVSLFFSLKYLLISINEGSYGYSQSLSYYAAICFVFDLYLLLFGDNYSRFRVFKSKLYKYLSGVFLVYYVVILFFSGGRGALGTIVLGTLVILFTYAKHRGKSLNQFYGLVFLAVVGSLVLPLVFSSFDQQSSVVFMTNRGRVFSFFTSTDMYERTSGRDVVFSKSIELIEQQPVLGYGLFSYKAVLEKTCGVGYPHNLFLEVLLQGGFLFLVIFIVVLVHFFVKLIKLIRRDVNNAVLLPFVVYSFSLLMYSGSYMQVPFFWFCIAYVLNFRIPKRLHVTK